MGPQPLTVQMLDTAFTVLNSQDSEEEQKRNVKIVAVGVGNALNPLMFSRKNPGAIREKVAVSGVGGWDSGYKTASGFCRRLL